MKSFRCASAFCEGHSDPKGLCTKGLWFCGRLRPPCGGHAKASDPPCDDGALWHCGVVGCGTHRFRDRCPISFRWICGAPWCPKNHQRKTGEVIPRCVEGAWLIPHFILTGAFYLRWIAPVLRSPEAQRLRFTLGPVTLDGGRDFEKVCAAIEHGHIKVRYDSTLRGKQWKYRAFAFKTRSGTENDLPGNTLAFSTDKTDPLPTLRRVEYEALLIHESVHAAADLHAKPLTSGDDEAAAIVAQTMYLLLRNAYSAGPTHIQSLPACIITNAYKECQEASSGTASLIAREFLAGRQPSPQMIQALHLSLMHHPLYHDKYSEQRCYDG